jgi:hypothetical protein
MPTDLAIAQAVLVADAAGPRVVARSDDFPAAWEDAAATAAVRFGRRPPGVGCPAAVFAVPVGRTHVAVVQVADLAPTPDPPLGFRFLILARKLYEALGDPFAIADRHPPDWSAKGTLPSLEWPPEPLPPRTVASVQHVMKTGDLPLLLGATQALIDGSRLLLVADTPRDDFCRGLWHLLPYRTRCELWPASFAFSAELGFHAVALPAAPDPWPVGYLTDEQARDYPEGRYELALQIAAEAGDQGELTRLFARRSSLDTIRLGLYLLAAAVVLAVASKVFL